MNKKMNYLAFIPVFGAVVLLFWLFIKVARGEINKKKFNAYFFSSGLFGFLSVLVSVLFLNFIYSLIGIRNFIENYGLLIAYIVGGYSMNLFTFALINKKWNDLQKF